jgi:tripartite-type tricarboxylate transporter receptor subunit TctC
MGKFPMILVVGANSGIATAKDFIARAKAKPGDVSYASAGAGSPHHLAMELLKVEAGLFMVHVPYRGAAPALADVAGGQLPAMMVDLAAGAGFIKGGKVRALAVANPTRLPQLPDVPTFAELGFEAANLRSTFGIFAPARVPEAVVARLNDEVNKALAAPDLRERLRATDNVPTGGNAKQFAELISDEFRMNERIVKEAGIRAE